VEKDCKLADCRFRKADPMSDDTYYAVLGVSETATQLEIKAALSELAQTDTP
jgi:hypothetical protein